MPDAVSCFSRGNSVLDFREAVPERPVHDSFWIFMHYDTIHFN